MTARIEWGKAAPDAYRAVLALQSQASASANIEPMLRHLLCMRVSQINGCAFCLDMHAKDLRAGGEKDERIDTLSAWRETPFFSDRERAALAWAEAVTNIADGPVSDEVYQEARRHFDERALIDLNLVVATINVWNRFGVAFQLPPGQYKPAGASHA
jgi:AhpD family alkylhydroperoxidase